MLSDKAVEIRNLSDNWSGLHLAGPASGRILASLADIKDLSFLQARRTAFSACGEATVIRVSFTGECGYELYFPIVNQLPIFHALLAAGESASIKPVGSHALMSMRLEKSFPSWGLELSADYYPHQCGLDRFIDWDKNGFIGREAALAARGSVSEYLVTVELHAEGYEAHGGEPLFAGEHIVGYATSGGLGHRCGKNLALAFVNADLKIGERLQMGILDRRFDADIISPSPFDPAGLAMRTTSA